MTCNEYLNKAGKGGGGSKKERNPKRQETELLRNKEREAEDTNNFNWKDKICGGHYEKVMMKKKG